MTTNMGIADRLIRLLLVTALIIVWATNIVHGTLAIVVLVIAGILLLTAFVGRCPLYTFLGINSRTKKV